MRRGRRALRCHGVGVKWCRGVVRTCGAVQIGGSLGECGSVGKNIWNLIWIALRYSKEIV